MMMERHKYAVITLLLLLSILGTVSVVLCVEYKYAELEAHRDAYLVGTISLTTYCYEISLSVNGRYVDLSDFGDECKLTIVLDKPYSKACTLVRLSRISL